MEQSKQDDQTNWGEAGPLRIRRRVVRALEDIGATIVDAYQVVYPQESVWLLHMRLTELGRYSSEFVLVFSGAEPDPFEGGGAASLK